MQPLPQIEPLSKLQGDHEALIAQTEKGPVILSKHDKAAYVLMSAAEWDHMARELKRLRRLERVDQIAAEMNADPAKRIPVTKEELLKQGLLDG